MTTFFSFYSIIRISVGVDRIASEVDISAFHPSITGFIMYQEGFINSSFNSQSRNIHIYIIINTETLVHLLS